MWFDQGIQLALNKAENEKIILLTFIKGQNEDSDKLNKIFDEQDFKSQLNDSFVALKFEENSNEANMFCAIYPIESTPTIYLIASDAKVLDTITGFLEKNELVTRINTALGIQSAERNEAMKTNAQPAAQSSTLDLKNKEVHAQQLLKDLRAKKAVEEEEKERELEKDRIRTSKELQTAREIQKQKELEDIVKQRKIEKREEQIARQRVLDQIKQDQEDRKERANLQANAAPKPLVISQPKTITSDETRIQFRLPDSSIIKEVFKIKDSLRTIVRYVEEKTDYSNLRLVLNFPKKEFADEDLDKTLVDLKLVPSAVLIVKIPTVNPNFGCNLGGPKKDILEVIKERELIRTMKMNQYVKEQIEDREENELIRIRTLDLIEQDRLERRIRTKLFKNAEPEPDQAKPKFTETVSKILPNETRIQIRLPDSSVLKDIFDINDTLETIFDYIERKTSYRDFSLVSQNFTKAEFTSLDKIKKLSELNLVPSGVLMVKTSSRSTPYNSLENYYDHNDNYYMNEDY